MFSWLVGMHCLIHLFGCRRIVYNYLCRLKAPTFGIRG
jgi:hypothetical protein